MRHSIADLQAAADRSEHELQKLLREEARVKMERGHGFGHITVAHRIVAWIDRKRLQYALKRDKR